MIIIGAGMSGMLAGHYFRHLNPIILEKQETLPNNHKALLRFRSQAVSDLTGIPFKEVTVQKMIQFEGAWIDKPNLFINNLYSSKVTGAIRQRSIGNLDDCKRYIAPDDFISKLSNGLDVKFNQEVDCFDNVIDEPIISTIPVYSLAKSLGYKLDAKLKSREIWTATADISADVDVYQTIYYPSDKQPFYRISITGNKMIVEFSSDPSEIEYDRLIAGFRKILRTDFGIDSDMVNHKISHQQYGKLVECDTDKVKEFIGWATRERNIYSLGRWGTHRQILMDDVVKDVKQIDKLIRNNGYNI